MFAGRLCPAHEGVEAVARVINAVDGWLARTVDARQVHTVALNEHNYVQLVSSLSW